MAFRRRDPSPDDVPPTEVTQRLPAAPEYGYVEEPVVEEVEVVEEPPRRPPVLWPYLLLLLAIVVGVVAAVWYFTRDEEPDTTPVASVVRLPEGDAPPRRAGWR